MQNRVLHIFFGFFMAFTLSFNLGIRQMLHTFEHHEDTIHSCGVHEDNSYADKFLDTKHHHCDYLTDLLPHFTNTILSFDFNAKLEPEFQNYAESKYSFSQQSLLKHYYTRGPPKAYIS